MYLAFLVCLCFGNIIKKMNKNIKNQRKKLSHSGNINVNISYIIIRLALWTKQNVDFHVKIIDCIEVGNELKYFFDSYLFKNKLKEMSNMLQPEFLSLSASEGIVITDPVSPITDPWE